MTDFRISEAAQLLGVSDDTVRRWVEAGHLSAGTDAAGRRIIAGTDLARHLRERAAAPEDRLDRSSSARNRFVGIVTDVVTDTVMAQVEIQSGPHRLVSLMSSEAVRELGLEPGSLATASIKATLVVVETPQRSDPTPGER